MIYIVLNAAAILIATLAGLIFGALYHGVARSRWTRDSRSLALVATAFVAEFWLCAILAGALILAPPKGNVWTMTLGSAFIIWIGFVVPVLVATYRYRGIAMRTASLDCGHWLGVMLVQATVLRMVGLVPPPA